MNLPEPNFADDLDALIRETLKSQTKNSEPSKVIWLQIKRELKTKPASLPPPRRVLWPAPMAQLLFILLLTALGGFGLRATSGLDDPQPVLVADLSPSETERYLDEYSTTPPIEFVNDEYELNMVKNYLRAQHNKAGLKYYPLLITPTDVMPHPLSPAGRSLKAERSENSLIKDQVFSKTGSSFIQ